MKRIEKEKTNSLCFIPLHFFLFSCDEILGEKLACFKKKKEKKQLQVTIHFMFFKEKQTTNN